MGGGLRRLFKKESSTEEEIKQLVEGDENVGELEKNQRVMINNIFEFDDLNAGDIMTHRTDIDAVDINDSIEEAVKLSINEGRSRIPVFKEDLDNICGIIYVKDLLKFVGTKISGDDRLTDYIRKPLFVPETIPCGKLFAQMTEKRTMMAIVVDEYGGTAGLVTTEDVMECIFGNIRDEYDNEEEQVTKIDDKTYTFDGISDIDDVSEVLGVEFPEGDYDTLAGFVINLLGFLPTGENTEQEVCTYEGLTFTVLEVSDRRIEKIKVMIEQIIEFEALEQAVSLFGSFDENIKLIEKEYSVSIISRGTDLKVVGDAENVSKATRALNSMLMLISKGESLTNQNVRYVLSLVNEGNEDKLSSMSGDSICITSKGKPVKPKTLGQKKYCEAIRNNTITFGVGPAGTGKTYLAVAMAVTAFRAKEVNRIILTRPAVEAGEKLGFLPGDLQSKVDPYLRPLYDALFDMLGAENFQRCQERGAIEVAPLAYMRGRTLDDSFIILDEAQNTTSEQMKMFLTRLGFGSKMVITGDITQIDLPDGKKSGLKKVLKILKDIDDIATCRFNQKDVVRHKLVQDIVNAYQKYEEGK